MQKPYRRLVREFPRYDVLADVLDTLGLRSRLFCRSELAAPWALEFSAGEQAYFHIMERGNAWIRIDRRPALALASGDVLLVSRNTSYVVSHGPHHEQADVVELPEADPAGRCELLRKRGTGSVSVLICGAFTFEQPEDHPLLSALPKLMRLPELQTHGKEWLGALTSFLVAEASDGKPGTVTVLSRLTDILFVQVLRAWLTEQHGKVEWLGALKDPQIGPALALIHEHPGSSWTVRKLAARSGLTRSPFSARFVRLVGETPQAYLTRVRMEHAARAIRQHKQSIGEIAAAVGFQSESSFNKAFKRHYGKTPGRYRRELHT